MRAHPHGETTGGVGKDEKARCGQARWCANHRACDDGTLPPVGVGDTTIAEGVVAGAEADEADGMGDVADAAVPAGDEASTAAAADALHTARCSSDCADDM